LAVVRANDGNTPLDEGTQVGLDWNDALLRVLNAGEVAA
jgi:putative spermidine/putrescine transport system ATP-binding protein